MDHRLDQLIEGFRAAQDIGVAVLTRDLRIPIPSSGRDWWVYCKQNGLYEIEELQGIPIRAHGFGIELTIGSMIIDFDWGPNGEQDGFDGWRLYVYPLNNDMEEELSHAEINDLLQSAFGAGELIKIDELYFDPKRRAPLKS